MTPSFDTLNKHTVRGYRLVEKTERATPEVKFCKNPATGEVYRYKGFGGIAADVKTWLTGSDGKRIEKYRCNEDGSPLK